jgi:hypothetical protein
VKIIIAGSSGDRDRTLSRAVNGKDDRLKFRAAPGTRPRGQDVPGAGLLHAVGDGLRPEDCGKRHGDRADLVDREVGEHGLEALAEVDRDP